MTVDKLKNAPLVEAILEIRWQLTEQSPGVTTDPNYKLLIGRLYDKASSAGYSHHEPLPTASMPDEILGHVVQHRFRVAPDKWPLIQIGPGIITLNQTTEYEWNDFEARGTQLVEWLFDIYPKSPNKINITNIQLKYIDAIPFDYEADDILVYIEEKLGIQMKFPAKFFDDAPIQKKANGLNSVFTFPTTNPDGTISLHFGTGFKEKNKVILWETIVQSEKKSLVNITMPEGFKDWFKAAHTLTHNMFFKLIEGSLVEQFK